MWSRPLAFILWWQLAFVAISTSTSDIAPACPEDCLCSTTEEDLHKAVCTSLSSLQKYSVRNKLHNINIINLHGAGVVKINNELDKFSEVVSLDLSDNKIEHLSRFMQNSKKLTHVNLSRNKLRKFSATALPSSVSSLDLSKNRLENVPSSLQTLTNLEHLSLKGNPLECSCQNIKILEHIHKYGVVLDDIKCINRPHRKVYSWKDFKVIDLCSNKKSTEIKENLELDEMMMGDQPAADTEMIGEETSDRKSMPMTDSRDLSAGEVFESTKAASDKDDDNMFINVHKKEESDPIEGSGDVDVFSTSSYERSGDLLITETSPTTEAPEGSGIVKDSSTVESYDYDGSGDDDEFVSTTTELFMMGEIHPFFSSEHIVTSTDEPFETPEAPSVFMGIPNWDQPDPDPTTTTTTLTPLVEEIMRKEHKILQNAAIEESQDNNDDFTSADSKDEKAAKSSVGTYVCIGILIAILVVLIGVAIIKNETRKRKEKKYIRQQKKDVEKAGKEMVDMNKSLLGKPATGDLNESGKKANGTYELVPTHEPPKKNGTIDSRKSIEEAPVSKVDAPKEMSANPNNNVPSHPTNEHNRPLDIPDLPLHVNGHSSPHLNGRHYPDSNLLGPNDYIPIYDPDSGRVKIKLTETPKPKTPVVITRSRSNAGDIVITPVSESGSPVKNAT